MITYIANTHYRNYTCVKAGDYRFEVIEANEGKTRGKSRSDKIELIMHVWLDKVLMGMIRDDLVFCKGSFWKVERFYVAIDRIICLQKQEYEAKEVIGSQGNLTVIVKKYNGRWQNDVIDYF